MGREKRWRVELHFYDPGMKLDPHIETITKERNCKSNKSFSINGQTCNIWLSMKDQQTTTQFPHPTGYASECLPKNAPLNLHSPTHCPEPSSFCLKKKKEAEKKKKKKKKKKK